jgi:DNA-binding protein H-NS
MIGHLLTDKEVQFLVELLEVESKRVAVEARRTDAHVMHKEIRERQRTIDRIAERLQEVQAGDYKA